MVRWDAICVQRSRLFPSMLERHDPILGPDIITTFYKEELHHLNEAGAPAYVGRLVN
jgi:hypothetical protein